MKKITILILLFLTSYLCLSQSDCPPTAVCAPFSDVPNGSGTGGQFGEINSVTDGCLNGEHNSTWITITILTSGTLQFVINPVTNSNDFDFAVWGPNSGCPPASTPLKCSYAANVGNTGINSSLNVGGANSEGVFGDVWVDDINVTAGEVYLILVDNFTTNNGFDITFGGTSTLDCSLLPVALSEFSGYDDGGVNVIRWVTKSEINNDYFTLEKSDNGFNFVEIAKIDGAGNSSSQMSYEYIDENPNISYTYYRLAQTDFDGKYEYLDIISIENSSTVFYTYTTNPKDGFIYFSGLYYYELYNCMGERVKYAEDNKVDTSNLSVGFYILKIGYFTQKILVE